MSVSWDDELKLKMCYLFMLADGPCTPRELTMFEWIADAMDASAAEKRELLDKYKNMFDNAADNAAQIIQEMTRLFQNEGMFWGMKHFLVDCIWYLTNLGYADVYSEPKRRVMNFLVEHWEIDSAVFADINDTAETILVLSKQKDWIKRANQSYDVTSKRIAEIDRELEQLENDIHLLAKEY